MAEDTLADIKHQMGALEQMLDTQRSILFELRKSFDKLMFEKKEDRFNFPTQD